jgi:hypothetical protein
MATRLLTATLAGALLVTGCAGTPQVQTGADAEVIGNNLHRVDNSRADIAYIDPAADFSRYSRVQVEPLGVNNIEIIQPDDRGSVTRRVDWELNDKDRRALQEMYRSAMVKQLQEKGHFPVVDEPGDDVLMISAMITAIAPNAAKDDAHSRTAGRSYVITEGAGAIAVAVGFADSETGEILALVKDSRATTSNWGLNNSVTNRADVQRMFNSWALQIASSLAKVTGKE